MLTVDVERRISIDECLAHPWITGQGLSKTGPNANGAVEDTQSSKVSATDSTEGLAGAFHNKLDFSHRKVQRERTLLAAINDVKVTRTIEIEPGSQQQLKVYAKNDGEPNRATQRKREELAQKVKKQEEKAVAGKKEKEKPQKKVNGKKEATPAGNRDPEEFAKLGGVGDQPLFTGGDEGSVYPETTMAGETLGR